MEFSFENIASGDDSFVNSLFDESAPESNEQENEQQSSAENDDSSTEKQEEVDVNNLFDVSESVSSEENEEKQEDTASKENGASDSNFYSSIANALKEDGVLHFSDDVNITDADSFAKAIDDAINKRFDEKQQRINEALNAGVPTTEIQQYEKTIDFLNAIDNDSLDAEDSKGETLRKNLIYQDLLNRGYTEDEAKDELQDILDAGVDKKRAVKALNANKEFFKKRYQSVIDAQQSKINADKDKIKQQAEELKKSMLEDDKAFGFSIDKSVRQKAFDNTTKAVYKDEAGNYMTAIQKYEKENPVAFRRNLALLFTMTDSFKNIEALSKPLVKKEVNKNLKELEKKINSTSRMNDGSMRFSAGVGEDDFSYSGFGTKWDLNI